MKCLLNRKAGKGDTKERLHTRRTEFVNNEARCDSIRQNPLVNTLKALQDTIHHHQKMLHQEQSNQRLQHLYAMQVLDDTTPSYQAVNTLVSVDRRSSSVGGT